FSAGCLDTSANPSFPQTETGRLSLRPARSWEVIPCLHDVRPALDNLPHYNLALRLALKHLKTSAWTFPGLLLLRNSPPEPARSLLPGKPKNFSRYSLSAGDISMPFSNNLKQNKSRSVFRCRLMSQGFSSGANVDFSEHWQIFCLRNSFILFA